MGGVSYHYLVPVTEKRKLEPALTFVGMRGVSDFWPRGAPFFVLCAGNIGVLFFSVTNRIFRGRPLSWSLV